MDFAEHFKNETGIDFDFKNVVEKNTAETLSATGDKFSSYETETEHSYATAFAFPYKGARITGTLPSTYAGFYTPLDYEAKDLMPAVNAACGFAVELAQVQ